MNFQYVISEILPAGGFERTLTAFMRLDSRMKIFMINQILFFTQSLVTKFADKLFIFLIVFPVFGF